MKHETIKIGEKEIKIKQMDWIETLDWMENPKTKEFMIDCIDNDLDREGKLNLLKGLTKKEGRDLLKHMNKINEE